MKKKNLGDIINETIEEYNPHRTRCGRIVEKIDQFREKHDNKIKVGTIIAAGAAGALLGYSLIKDAKAIMENNLVNAPIEQIRQQSQAMNYQIAKFCGAYGLAGVGAGLFAYATRIIETGKRKLKRVGEEKKESLISRLSLPIGLSSMLAWHYDNIIENIQTINKWLTIEPQSLTTKMKASIYEGNLVIAAASILVGGYVIKKAVQISESIAKDKKFRKDIANYFRYSPHAIIGLFSKKKQKEYLLKHREKNPTLNQVLSKLERKKNLPKSMDYLREYLDRQEGNQTAYQKGNILRQIGLEGTMISTHKNSWSAYLDLPNLLPEELCRKINNKVMGEMKGESLEIRTLLALLSHNVLKDPQNERLSKLMEEIVETAHKNGGVKEFSSSEGKVYLCEFSDFFKNLFVVREGYNDLSHRFLKQKFEYEVLKKQDIKVEEPILFVEKDSRALFRREGYTTLREHLQGKNNSEKEKAFREAVEYAIECQERLYLEITKKEGLHFMELSDEGAEHSIIIKNLNMHDTVIKRAFLGDEKRKDRFGANDSLPDLIRRLYLLEKELYHPIGKVLAHGDLFATNMSEKIVRYDARHIIADAIYDPTYLSLDPIFLSLSKEKKEEIIYEALRKRYDLKDEKNFRKSFEYAYLLNGLGLSASQKANNMPENARMILYEVIKLSGGKQYERDLMQYLKKSEAKEIM